MAGSLGFEVRTVDLPRGVDARLRISGASRVIELAAGQARVRHRFSVAHELGHSSLGHRHGETDGAEQEANAFASALLVPQSWLKRDLGSFPTVAALAERYDVSRDVVLIAAERARLLDRLG
jgi:Zn-dependent peptidase ImmA (M78 family)